MKQFLGIVLLASLGFVSTQNAGAIAIPVLTLTEVSSTELDYSWSTGEHGVLTSAAGNDWEPLGISGPALAGGDAIGSNGTWAEPENAQARNLVFLFTLGGTAPWSLRVFSDGPGVVANANGDTINSVGNSFQVTFRDNGDSVPDSGSTLLLLALGLLGVGLLRVTSKARTLQVWG
jgi:hypothetical protein